MSARRALCSVCQREMTVTRAGGIRAHGYGQAAARRGQHQLGRCDGSGRPPAPERLVRDIETVQPRSDFL